MNFPGPHLAPGYALGPDRSHHTGEEAWRVVGTKARARLPSGLSLLPASSLEPRVYVFQKWTHT